MYASNHFDKKEMTEWENKNIAIKDDFDKAKLYFEGLVKDYKVYAQNSGGTAGKHNFDSVRRNGSANQDHVGPDRATHQSDGQQRKHTQRRQRRRRQRRQRRRRQIT
jgi:hypothetical protein